MLAITDPNVRQVTIMGPTQLLKTSVLENTFGYYAHQSPSPILLAQPTVEIAEAFGRERIDPMVRDTPVLRELVSDKKSRDGSNTLTFKAFPGGFAALVGVNAPSKLASRPIRVALGDEIDKWPKSSGKEGDPVTLIKERLATFFDSKAVFVCSPTIEGDSRIQDEYEQGDKRIYLVPCPHCEHAEEMSWQNVKWPEGEPEKALYHCGKCEKPWTETQRQQSIRKGYWLATAEFKGHASFKCSKLVSPWQPVSVMALKFLEAKGKPEKMKAFVNTQLAETWVEKGEAPDYQRLYERRELYKINELPDGVAFITGAADVQKDRIEVEIKAWLRDKQNFSIDYRVLVGDTSNEKDAVWAELDKVLNETWITNDKRELQVRMFGIDSGYNTTQVYSWAKRHSINRVRVLKGSDSLQMHFAPPKDADVNGKDGSRLRRAVKVWSVGVSYTKTEMYGWLKLDKPEDGKPYPAGYCHFPEYGLEHFKRLCSEQLMKTKLKNGKTVYRWTQIYERNEQLDIAVYNRAIAAMVGIDRMSQEEFDILEGKHELPGDQERVKHQEANESSDTSNPDADYWDRQKGRKLF